MPPDPRPPRAYSLPRLPPEYYQGDAVVHWTLTVFDRATGWLSDSLHSRFRELMLHAAAREGLFCPTYCLMPDHIHLIWMGLRLESDQRNGMSFLRRYLEPVGSPQPSRLTPGHWIEPILDEGLRIEPVAAPPEPPRNPPSPTTPHPSRSPPASSPVHR